VIIDGKTYPGMANLGTRPSFGNGTLAPILEVHILDFAKNIYGKHVTVEFLQKIRSEKKFSSPQELIAQIKKDEVTARNLQIIKNM
jgi:riboflavin kinase/FMN adenylyltransferase